MRLPSSFGTVGGLILAMALFSQAADAALPEVPSTRWASGGIATVSVSDDLEVLSGDVVPGTVSVSNAFSAASLTATLSPLPTITASASGFDPTTPSTTSGAAFAQGVLLYFFRLNTPDGLLKPDTVGVATSGSVFSMAPSPAQPFTGGSDSRAKLTVNGTTVVNAISSQGVGNAPFSLTTAVPITTNQVFLTEMFVRAWTFEPGMSALTVLDPYFILTPEQIAAGYTLEFSAGVGNVPPNAVPLPAGAPLFAMALLLAARGARRTRLRA
ncbi:MAG: hypothetical protein AB7I01_00170 [Gammaproteobacteria bacterium]